MIPNIEDNTNLLTKENCHDIMNKAYEYTYGDRDDFQIALIPFQIKQNDICNGREHWMLGIYDRKGSRTREWLYLYDPLKFYGEEGKIKKEHNAFLRHLLNTLHPVKCNGTITQPQRLNFNKQADNDIVNSGVYIYLYAKQYLTNDGRIMIKNLDIKQYRSEMLEIIRNYVILQRYNIF